MKKFILSLSLTFIGLFVFAATPYESSMKGLLLKLKSAESIDDYTSIKNGFTRIGNVEKKEWLPQYYVAFCNVLQANMTKDPKEIDAFLDVADEHISKAMIINENDELLVLQSWSKSTRIMVNAMTRGQKYGAEAALCLEKAAKLNPNNPRVYFLQGQSAFYTPEAFGGSKDRAKQLFTKASTLFETEKPDNELMPTWGKEQNATMILQLK